MLFLSNQHFHPFSNSQKFKEILNRFRDNKDA